MSHNTVTVGYNRTVRLSLTARVQAKLLLLAVCHYRVYGCNWIISCV